MMAKKKFKFPRELLEQINECSFGGFLLFNFNEDGEFQTFGMFDSKIHAQAMERNLTMTMKALEKTQIETMSKTLDLDDDERGPEDPGFKI